VGDLSPHFSSWEFAEHGSGKTRSIDRRLLDVLESIRSGLRGRPLPIVSGYRSAAYNRRIGGAPRSQHIYGRAADIPGGLATVEDARRAGAVGIGYCGRWVVHVDVRPGPSVTFEDC
jgi:uncharacterized protein YcbK (DUF882 family)